MAEKRVFRIELGLVRKASGGEGEEKAVLELKTDTTLNGCIYSNASVCWEGNGLKTFVIYGDFNLPVSRSPKQRGTQKNIDTMHNSTFTPETQEALKAQALEFYATRAKRFPDLDEKKAENRERNAEAIAALNQAG